MSKNKFMRIGLSVMLAASMLAGCNGNTDQPSTPSPSPAEASTEAPDVSEEPEEPSEAPEDSTGDANGLDDVQYLNHYLSAEPATLDPSKIADTYGNEVLYSLIETLTEFRQTEDGGTEIAPAGAESWEVSDDGTVYTFKLRENAKWEDGEPVTAAHYEYGIKRTADPDTASPNSHFVTAILNAEKVLAGELPVDELGVVALDDYTLEITLEGPTPYFMSMTYQNNLAPLRPEVVEQYGETYGTEASNFLSNGPFKLTGWVHNSEITIEKNENYWDAENVYLERASYAILEDENARHNSFDNNSVDVMVTTIEEWLDRFGNKEGVSHVYYPTTNVNYSFFNVNDDIFQNANIRKAFVVAADRIGFNEAIFSGTYEPAYGWVQPGLSVDATEYRSVVEEPYKKLIEETDDPQALLLQGMEELGLGDDPGALKIVWSFGGTSQRLRTIGEFFQQSMKQSMGVNIEIELNEWPIFQSKIVSGDFQIGYMGWGAEYNDPYSMLSLNMTDSNALNTGWSNEEYDSILKEASVELDAQKRTELYQRAEEILLYEEAVINPVVYVTINRFLYSYVHGFPNLPQLTQGFRYVYTQGRP